MSHNYTQFLIAGLLIFTGGIFSGAKIFEAGLDGVGAVGYSVKKTITVSQPAPTENISDVVPNTNSSAATVAQVDILHKLPIQGGPSHVALYNRNSLIPNSAYLVHEGANTMQNVSFDVGSSPSGVPFVAGGTTNLSSRPRSVGVAGNYAYVVNDQTNMLSVFDVSTVPNPTPVRIGSNQASGVPTGRAPRAVAVEGNYVFVANYGDSTVQIFDASAPASVHLIGSVSLPANSGLVSISVAGNYAYVTQQMLNSVQIIDVSNKAAPVLRGAASVGSGVFPYDTIVSGNYAYVAGTAKSVIKVLDVSNPLTPSVVGSLYTGPNSTPSTLAISGRYLYVGNAAPNTIDVIDVANPIAPQRLTSFSVGASGVNSLAVFGDYIFVAGRSAVSNLFQIAKLSFVSSSGVR